MNVWKGAKMILAVVKVVGIVVGVIIVIALVVSIPEAVDNFRQESNNDKNRMIKRYMFGKLKFEQEYKRGLFFISIWEEEYEGHSRLRYNRVSQQALCEVEDVKKLIREIDGEFEFTEQRGEKNGTSK